jgi:hypothetical protein
VHAANIITRTSHYESFTTSGMGYNPNLGGPAHRSAESRK